MQAADLHLHTNFSDGTFSPAELVAAAVKQTLSAIALTDHDTVGGCAATGEACSAAGIEFVPASELTAEVEGEELHLLGYYLDTTEPRLLAAMARFQEVRQGRIREMVARLNGLGIPLETEAVFRLANCRSPGRPHVARALVAGGFCRNLDEAFERFLKRNRPAWVPKFKISAADAIELIHGAGGVAVMAHPGLNRIDEHIPGLVEAGLEGLECFHTKHPPSTAAHYVEMAGRLGLLVTGGSDCHGLSKGKPLIGTVRLPYEHVQRLRERAMAGRAPAAGTG
jgi:predicted metal-dependent phosphoesterase TrpH